MRLIQGYRRFVIKVALLIVVLQQTTRVLSSEDAKNECYNNDDVISANSDHLVQGMNERIIDDMCNNETETKYDKSVFRSEDEHSEKETKYDKSIFRSEDEHSEKETKYEKSIFRSEDEHSEKETKYDKSIFRSEDEHEDVYTTLKSGYENQLPEEMNFRVQEKQLDEAIEHIKKGMRNMLGDMLDDDSDGSLHEFVTGILEADEDVTVQPEAQPLFEYPKLERIDPVKVGHEQWKDVGEGDSVKLITRAVHPPIFEIPHFLTDDDCDYIIEASNKKGFKTSTIFSNKIGLRVTSESRISNSTALEANKENVEFLTKLQTKVALLLGVPVEVVKYSEPLSVAQYWPGGFYHAHQDSSSMSPTSKPCCFQTKCPSVNGTEIESRDCCQLCRVVTLLHYLDDVDEGGETAFLFADKPLSHIQKAMENHEWHNLSKHCEQAALRIKPKRGTTILWYNHFLDRRGYLSTADQKKFPRGMRCEKRHQIYCYKLGPDALLSVSTAAKQTFKEICFGIN